MGVRVWPGQPHPLGAHWDGRGTNFALASPDATAVRLCLFDDAGSVRPSREVALPHHSHGVWHGYLPEVRPPQLYGYRVDGPWDPDAGMRFNPAKLLVDPYARALSGPLRWDDALVGEAEDGSRDPRDSAPLLPRGVVVDPSFPWGDDRPPRTPWSRTLIYECHVKGLTQLHPEVPEADRGTYRALASEPILEHLRSLGVTAVELLPVHHAVSERRLVEQGLRNYWGYNTLGFFAPDARFASGDRGEQVVEFKSMVRALHAAGIEVLLDVVYNHTAEGGSGGPTLSWRGLDDWGSYHRDPADASRYADYTGCGNSLNAADPHVLQLILDSLRYWVSEMHVDGFRFDLAPALARRPGGELDLTGFFSTLEQDPVLADVKLIAEPWDVGPDGYQLGAFRGSWSEWNDSYRDAVRRFWRGDSGLLGAFAAAVSGSAEVFEPGDRSPFASINYVTSHDGFPLRDLVSYEDRHNEANGEQNHDGHDANWSRNWGAEGPTDSDSIAHVRARVRRSLVATLAFSQGVPMLLHGDELGRTQRGNNNAYCQDNVITWLDWDLDEQDQDFLAFVRRALALRAGTPLLRRGHFFSGEVDPAGGEKDVIWLRPDGREMKAPDWHDAGAHALGMLVPCERNPEEDAEGHAVATETLLVVFNAGARGIRFRLPVREAPGVWRHTLCSAGSVERRLRGASVRIPPRSASLLSYREPR
jgi:glycogen operon protein